MTGPEVETAEVVEPRGLALLWAPLPEPVWPTFTLGAEVERLAEPVYAYPVPEVGGPVRRPRADLWPILADGLHLAAEVLVAVLPRLAIVMVIGLAVGVPVLVVALAWHAIVHAFAVGAGIAGAVLVLALFVLPSRGRSRRGRCC